MNTITIGTVGLRGSSGSSGSSGLSGSSGSSWSSVHTNPHYNAHCTLICFGCTLANRGSVHTD